MDIWISMHNNSQMANNLVKWWKTKFLNGYKQFSVDCGDGKVSDTEELLERLSSEADSNSEKFGKCSTPPLQARDEISSTPEVAPTPKKSTPQQHLNFEEFSCDVSVEKGDNKPGQERQEFSYTLYDFDGHGKITKDDIAGLVTTIYETLGSSVKVPHYGSKTIKVKLTISPDQRKHVSATIINQKNNQNEVKHQDTSIRYKRDLNVTIKEDVDDKPRRRKQQKPKTPTRKHRCCKRHEEELENENPFVSDYSSDACSRISGNLTSDDDERECSDNERAKPKKSHQKKYYRSTSPRYTIPNLFLRDANICNANNCTRKVPKKRSGSLQRQELLEIIQANMDKNNLGFQTARKHSHHVSTQTKQLVEPQNAQKLQYLANIVDPTHFYVDLGSLQNTTQLPQTGLQYDKLIDAVMCVSNKKILNKQRCRKHRGKNDFAEIPFRYQFLQYPAINEENNVQKSNKRRSGEVKNKTPHVATGHTSSPHHLRHRNRQEDQARAMAQVVRWLEQEFSSNLNMKDKAKANNFQSTHKEKATNNSAPSTPNSAGVERHEHHHVHEHIHHHYHHYQESPLVV